VTDQGFQRPDRFVRDQLCILVAALASRVAASSLKIREANQRVDLLGIEFDDLPDAAHRATLGLVLWKAGEGCLTNAGSRPGTCRTRLHTPTRPVHTVRSPHRIPPPIRP
jgi:hypothetical protein